MRTRVLSSVVVVFGGLVPTLIGGPIFALLLIFLSMAGYREYMLLTIRVNSDGFGAIAFVGHIVIAALGFAALVGGSATSLFAIAFLAVVAPLAFLFLRPEISGGITGWSLATTGSLYLGLPVYAAVAIRTRAGAVDAVWLTDLAERLSIGWEAAPRGLAVALTIILATWVGDSLAYLAGMSLGKRQLAITISPNKTVEGAVGGLLGAMAIGAVLFQSFGIGKWWLGLLFGIVVGLAGQLGDLAESILKRQAGVKDSGMLIPGHGGILDRIDSLLFAFPTGFLLAGGFERIGT